MWIKNSDGDRSATVTLMWIAFIVTTIAYIASMFVQIGPVVFRPFDVGATSTYFIPILTLYGGRRWTNAKYSVNNGGLSQEYTPDNTSQEVLNG
tara:strand:- start:1825 stop:2106 length:282 start_codon:yes stop_codon:yes gene_type:complete